MNSFSPILCRTLAASSLLIGATSGCAALFARAPEAPVPSPSLVEVQPAVAPRQERALAIATAVRFTLKNGLPVMLVRRTHLPIVTMHMVVRAGASRDPSVRPGVARLTADLLERGTKSRTAPQIAEGADFLGADLTSSAGADVATIGISLLKKDLGPGLDLLADVVQHPTFAPTELALLQEEYTASLKSSLDDANEVVTMAFKKAVLGTHPYGRATTIGRLQAIKREDVAAFYKALYRPNNAFMVVVGDLTVADAKVRLQRAFGGWQSQTIPVKPLPPPKASPKQIVLVDMDVNQSFIMLGNVGVRRNTPDYYAISVLNFILGGDFTSRLNQTIRDKQGLAYGASSRFAMYQEGGSFAASLNTQTASTAKALESLLAELRGIQDAPVTASELGYAKDYLTGSFPRRFETNENMAGEIEAMSLFGLGQDYLVTYRERIRAVSAADVQRVAKRYLQTGQYSLVVVAKAAQVERALGAFGKVRRVTKEGLIR